MRTLALFAALASMGAIAAGANPGGWPVARCAACSLLPSGATGADLTLSGNLTAANGNFRTSNVTAQLQLTDTTNSKSFYFIENNDTLELYNNAVAKIATLDIAGFSARMGTSTGYTVGSVGTASATTADVTSSGASNLISYTLPANALVVTNRCLRITGWGTALNNANAKTVALDVGSQTVISKILTPSIAGTTWKVQAIVCRSGSNTQDIYAEAWNPMGTTVSSVDANTVLYQAARTAGTQTETASIVIKGKTTTATTTDVTMDGLVVEFM